MSRVRSVPAALLIMAGALATGCASGDGGDTGARPATTTDEPATTDLDGELVVAAASSLTDAFTEIGDRFQDEHPNVVVTFTFDSSSSLANVVDEGAPVDVFASADERSMVGLGERGQVDRGPVFARNELTIVVPPGNPDDIEGLTDLTDLEVVSLCGEDVPCGRVATEALAAAGVELAEDRITRGQNARATLGAVADGDADAAIVYVTDAESAGDTVTTVAIPADHNATARYPIGVVVETDARPIADTFVDFVSGPEGQAVLRDHGFLAP